MRKSIVWLILCGALVPVRAEAASHGFAADEYLNEALVPVRAEAARPAADMGDAWHNIAALPAHSEVHVSADGGGSTCYLIAVDEQSLTCGRKDGGQKGQHVFARASVKSVKLTRYAVSAVAGTAIGAGVGLGVGLGTTQNKNGWFNGDIRGVFTGLGAVVGLAACGPGDAFRGPTVYRRMH